MGLGKTNQWKCLLARLPRCWLLERDAPGVALGSVQAFGVAVSQCRFKLTACQTFGSHFFLSTYKQNVFLLSNSRLSIALIVASYRVGQLFFVLSNSCLS